MNKLIKLSDTHYIIVDDSEIKEVDWYWTPIKRSIEQCIKKRLVIKNGSNDVKQFKITHSTEPLEQIKTMSNVFSGYKYISLSEVKEAIDGYNSDDLVFNEFEKQDKYTFNEFKDIFILGFKAHQKLVKDKLFTVSFIIDLVPKVLEKQRELSNSDFNDWYNSDFLRMLFPKTEWGIKLTSEGKIKLI